MAAHEQPVRRPRPRAMISRKLCARADRHADRRYWGADRRHLLIEIVDGGGQRARHHW